VPGAGVFYAGRDTGLFGGKRCSGRFRSTQSLFAQPEPFRLVESHLAQADAFRSGKTSSGFPGRESQVPSWKGSVSLRAGKVPSPLGNVSRAANHMPMPTLYLQKSVLPESSHTAIAQASGFRDDGIRTTPLHARRTCLPLTISACNQSTFKNSRVPFSHLRFVGAKSDQMAHSTRGRLERGSHARLAWGSQRSPLPLRARRRRVTASSNQAGDRIGVVWDCPPGRESDRHLREPSVHEGPGQ
jgi:hypothetical protein